MSPDMSVVARSIDRAVSRVRCLAAMESAALGAAVAAWSVAAGFVVAVASAWLQAGRISRRSVVRELERTNPQLRNLLVTTEEMATGALRVKPLVADRVSRDAVALTETIDNRRLLSLRRLSWFAAAAIVTWTTAFAFDLRHVRPAIPAASPRAPSEHVAAADPGVLHVIVTVAPPEYTGAQVVRLSDPAQVHAIEGSRLTFSVAAPDARLTVDVNGSVRALTKTGDRFEWTDVFARSGYVAISGANGAVRMLPIAVNPDARPSVQIDAPGRDLTYTGGNPQIAFAVRATDDYGLGSLTLKYTKVSGSGEQFDFAEGEIPLTISKSDGRTWTARATRRVSDFDLREGDMLVYYAAAADQRPHPGEGRSDAFFIEMSKIGAAAGDAFTLPERQTRYALSQQMLLVKTERLNGRRASMTEAELTEESQGLAVEQRMIRSELVFMLGGEIEDEEVEAQQSTELQEGRLANRGQRDLRDATVAMSQAERQLTAANLTDAVRFERAAVAALQRAFARDRYILRALPTQSRLDANRRLSGAVNRPVGWRRRTQSLPDNARAAQLLGLVEGLGEAARDAHNGIDARRQVAVLAALAVRIDPESAALRQTTADLQKLADAWPATTVEARVRAIESVVGAAAHEARLALADPPISLEQR